MSTNCNDHCISCVSGDKEQKYKKWHVFSGNPILLQKGTVQTTVPRWLPSSNQQGQEATMRKKANEPWNLKKKKEISLSFVGLSRMGVTPNWFRKIQR